MFGRRGGTAKERTGGAGHFALRKGPQQRSGPEIGRAPPGGAVRRPGRQHPLAGRVQQGPGGRSQEPRPVERPGILLLRAGKPRRSRAVAAQGPGDRPEASQGAQQFGTGSCRRRGDSTRVSRPSAKVVGPAAAHSNVGVLMAKQGRYDQARQAFHRGPRPGRHPATTQGILGLPRSADGRVAERHHPTPVRRATRRRSRRSLAARRPAGESRPRPGDARSPNRRSDRRPRAPASARAPAG